MADDVGHYVRHTEGASRPVRVLVGKADVVDVVKAARA